MQIQHQEIRTGMAVRTRRSNQAQGFLAVADHVEDMRKSALLQDLAQQLRVRHIVLRQYDTGCHGLPTISQFVEEPLSGPGRSSKTAHSGWASGNTGWRPAAKFRCDPAGSWTT